MVGWILTTKPSWSISYKVIVTVVFEAAVSINVSSVIKMYIWMGKVLGELEAVARTVRFHTPEIKDYLEKITRIGGWKIVIVVHVITNLFVLYCIWFLTN